MNTNTKKFSVLGIFIFCISLIPSVSFAAMPTNLLTNPGAESGATNWATFGGGATLQVSSLQSHTGIQSFFTAGRTQNYHGPSQNILPLFDIEGDGGEPLVHGERYEFSVWVYHQEATAQTFQFNIKQVDGAGTNYNTLENELVSPNTWTRITKNYVFDITGTLTALDLYVITNSGTFDFYTDDFYIGNIADYPSPPTSPATGTFVRASGNQVLEAGGSNPIIFQGINVTVPVDDSDGPEEVWNVKSINKENFQDIADMGFNAVRLLMNYEMFEDDASPVTSYSNQNQFRADGWEWLDKTIDHAKEAGLYVMLDMHKPQGGYQSDDDPVNSAFWDGDGEAPHTNNQTRLIALWSAIADRYQHEEQILGYDLINEPVSNTSEEWFDFAEDVIAAIRLYDTNHMIVVEAPFISSYTMRTVNDNNVMYDAHYYEPWDFATQYSSQYSKPRWGKYNTADNSIGTGFNQSYIENGFIGNPTPTVIDSQNHYEYPFDLAHQETVPVNVGEYGIVYEAFGQDVGETDWITDINNIFDGNNSLSVSSGRFYFSYHGGPFGLYNFDPTVTSNYSDGWAGFDTTSAKITVNSTLKSLFETLYNEAINTTIEDQSATSTSTNLALESGVAGVVSLPAGKEELRYASGHDIDFSTDTVAEVSTTNVNGNQIGTILENFGETAVTNVKKFRVNKASGVVENSVTFSNGTLTLEIPDGTDIYAKDDWNGIFTLPKASLLARNGYIGHSLVDIGGTGKPVILSNPVKITLPTTTGDPAYSTDGSTWAEIATCTDATTTSAGTLAFPGECYIENSGETIIWTYHFTSFGSFSVDTSGASSGAVELTFDTTSEIPADGKIRFDVPNDFTMDNISNMLTNPDILSFLDDGNDIFANIASASLTDNIITITLNNTAIIEAGSTLKIGFSGEVFDINPSLPGEYYIAWLTQNANETPIEQGSFPIDIENTVKITAAVLEALVLSLESTAINLVVNPSVNNGIDQSQFSRLNVSTNSPTYSIQAKLENSQGNDNGLHFFDGTTHNYIANGFASGDGPQNNGENIFGYNTTASGEATANFTNTATDIFTNQAGLNENITHDIFYDLNVDYLTPAGIYEGVITYTAVPAF